MSSYSLEPAETAVTRFTRGHFPELIKKDVGLAGILYAAKHDIHGKVMVKVLTSPDKYSGQEVQTLVKPFAPLRVICHQNIVRLLGSFFEDGTDAMRSGYVMEFMANGSLSAVIHDLSIEYNDNQVYSWIQQASRGIAYLHSQNIIHHDVNTRNMLLGETIDVLKISDCGLAKPDATTAERNTCLKPFYEQDSLSPFSLGIRIINGTRPKIELGMEEEMKSLILRSMEAQYTLRPKASDFTVIADKLGSETNEAPNAPKEQKVSLVESKNSPMVNNNNARQYLRRTPPSRPLSSEIQNSFDSKLTLLIGRGPEYNKPMLAFEHNTKTWKELDVKIPGRAVVLDEELYIFGGNLNGFWKTNLEYRSLVELSPIQIGQIPGGHQISVFVAYRSKIYVVVSFYGLRFRMENTVFAYDPAANSWSRLAPIKEKMSVEGITVLNDKLYIIGRDVNSRMESLVCSRIEAGYYDTVKDKWTYLSLDVPVPFSYIQAVTYKNELIIYNNNGLYASNLDGRMPWKTLPQPKTWNIYPVVFTCGNSLFVAGGQHGDPCSDAVESFDGMTWTELPRMPYGQTAFTTVTANGDLAKQLLKLSYQK